MPVLPSGCWPAGGGRHLLSLCIAILLLLPLPQSAEAQCYPSGRSSSGSYPLGDNISFECKYEPTRSPPSNNVTAPIPDPVFVWRLRSKSRTDFQPIERVLRGNLWYSNPSTKRTMSTVLLTRDHVGTYTCECSEHCDGNKMSPQEFLVSEIKEGLAVYTSNYQVLASTCGYRDYDNSGSAEEGTTLHCTSSFNNFNDGSSTRYPIEWCYAGNYYDLFWNRYSWSCDTSSYSTVTTQADHDRSQLRCSLSFGRYYRSYIYIQVTQRDAPTWKSCQANATEIRLTFDVDAYRKKYGNPDDVEVVITIRSLSQNSQISLSDTYTGALDQFRSGITLEYYSLSDGMPSRRQTIDVDGECGRPSVLRLIKCTANSTNLYLQFGEYKGSVNTVLEIELDNGTVIESLSNMTEYNISRDHVKKVEYYAVFSDGEQSLKGIQEKAACFARPITTPPSPPPTTRPSPRVYPTYPPTIDLETLVITTSVTVSFAASALTIGIILFGCLCSTLRQRKQEKAAAAAAALTPAAPVRHIVRYRHNVHLNAPFPSGDVLVSERAVDVGDFRNYMRQRRRDDCAQLKAEYTRLTNDNTRMTTAFGKTVMAKNRYSNIIPYDHNRVIMMGETDEDAYINGSYINGYNLPETYIAAQGPLPNTVCDFWEMVWGERSRWIVMLTKVDEDGVRKCEKYWPESKEENLRPGRDLVVELENVEKFDEYEIRDFIVTKENREVWRMSRYDEPLPVRQFHFLAWPDHGVPMYPSGLLRFMQEVRKHAPEYITPKIVHCSAGVGRSGTYIALDYCIDRLADTRAAANIIEVHGLVQMLRLQRPYMVQTEEQYIFVHDALLEYISPGTKLMTPDELAAALKAAKPKDKNSKLTGFEDEFDFMKEVSRKFGMIDQGVWLRFGTDNRYSNRCPYVGGYLDVLDERGMVVKEYINATMMDGHKQEKAYVAAQAPMAHSVDHFWSTILWDSDIHSVVVLADFEENEKDTCYKFWPDKEMVADVYGFVGVVLKNVTKYNGFTAYACDIRNEAQKRMKSREVVIFHYTKWPEDGRPAAYSHILGLMGELEKIQQKSDGRVLVACNDGMGRTGSFLCMHREIQRLKYEGLVSVFQTARALRGQRPYLIRTPEQYVAVYELMAEYLQSFDRYSKLE